MKRTGCIRTAAQAVCILALLFGILSLPVLMVAQQVQEGNNAVIDANSAQQPSVAFVDATPYVTGGQNICQAIKQILTDYHGYQAGLVIDARRISSTQSLSCNVNPWSGTLRPGSNTVLLPTGTIQTTASWVLPGDTHIVGQGRGKTIIQASSVTFPGNSPIIQMGIPGQGFVFGISISNLTLDGQNNASVDGIDNLDAEELSSVQHVEMINIAATGLLLSVDPTPTPPPNSNVGKSNHSGPYSDLSISVSNTGTCLSIIGAVVTGNGYKDASPRGIHGLSCTGNNSNAGIYLDGNNVSLQDVYVSGFVDGVLIGSRDQAYNDVLQNIRGGSGITRLIRISNQTNSLSTCPLIQNVCDITILGASTTLSTSTTIKDELPPAITLPNSTDSTVGTYIVGEGVTVATSPLPVIAYSRFSTSLKYPTWLVGASAPPTPACGTGSLFSVTSTGSGTTLWGCVAGVWTAIQ